MKEYKCDSTEIQCAFQDFHSETPTVTRAEAPPGQTVKPHEKSKSQAIDQDMANNKVSAENLVPEPGFLQERRGKRIWQIISMVILVFAVVMLALFIWQLSKQSAKSPVSERTQGNDDSVWPAIKKCPILPPLVSLPRDLPKDLNQSLVRIEDYLKKLVNPQSQLPAISATIYYKDKVLWSGHYGTKIAENKTPPNDDTRYRIGSITKVFPVIMLYKMYQDGLIDSLDDPLSKYAPDFHMNNPFTEENITLRQIANQLSGLPREAPCGACLNETTSSKQLALLRNRSLVVEPGTVPSYSNLGYALLGRLLTEMPKVNMTFEDWSRNKILIPLGLNNTGFRIDKEIEQDMAPSYNSLGNRVPFMDIKWLAPAGQMYSSPRDMALFGMYLNAAKKQSVLQTKYWREILSPSDIAPDGQTLWGSPWEMIFHKNFLVRGKGGAIDGYSAMVSVVPEIQLGFNVFINAAYHFKEGALIANTILDYVYREFLPVFNRTLFEVGGRLKFNNATMYIGTYNITKTSELTGEIESKYQATIDDHNYTLLYTENNKKTFLYDTEVPLLLRAAKDTSSCLESQLGNRAQFYFSPAVEGVSPGFLVPGWGITGVRV